MIRRRISETPFAIYCWIFQVVIVVSLTSVVIWLSLKPRTPDFSITNVYIPAFGTQKGQNSTLHQNETAQDASIIFNIQISNPNKRVGIYYEKVSVHVYSGEFFVGTSSSEGFHQGYKTSTVKEVVVDAGQHFPRGITDGNVELRVRLKTAVRYKILRWRTQNHHMGFEGFVTIMNGTMSTYMMIHKTP